MSSGFKATITIADAIKKIDSNDYLLPALQRQFVWQNDDIELLFDSLLRNYPISSFLFWEVSGDNKIGHDYYSFLKEYREGHKCFAEKFNPKDRNSFYAILDGQQRLTALYIGLKGSYACRKKYANRNDDSERSVPTRYLYLNIHCEMEEAKSEDGRIYDLKFLTQAEFDEDNGKGKWFRVGDIIDSLYQGNEGFNKFARDVVFSQYKDNEFAQKTLTTLHSVVHKDFLINYYLLEEGNYDKALNIFIRTNNGGQRLSFSDLLMSMVITYWKKTDAKNLFEGLINEIKELGFYISNDFILKCALVSFCDDIKFSTLNLSKDKLEEFETEWGGSEKKAGIRDAIKTVFALIGDFGYDSRTLTAMNAVIPIIYYVYKKGFAVKFDNQTKHKEDRILIKQWIDRALVKRIFGRSSDGVLKNIRDSIKNNLAKDGFPYSEIIDNLKNKGIDLDVSDDFIKETLLKTQYDNAYAFSILSLLYSCADYRIKPHKDHLHNEERFKKDKLKAVGIQGDKIEFYSNKEHWNSILNLQLLFGDENKSKKDVELIKWVKDKNINLEECLLPEEKHLEFSQFEKFIEKRKEILSKKLKERLQ